MGESAGELLADFRADLDIDEAIEIAEEGAEGPEGHLVIGTGILAVYTELALDLETGDDPRVVDADGPEILYTVADSFTGLLRQQAFLRFELGACAVRLKFGVPANRLELAEVRAALSRQGFSFRSFSDSVNLCGFRDDLRVGAFQLPMAFGWITLAGPDVETVEEVGMALARALDLRTGRLDGPGVTAEG